MAQGVEEEYIYVNERGAEALTPYLRLPMEHPEVFHPTLMPVTSVILAYSNAHQGTDKAVISLCITYGLQFRVIDVPRPSAGMAGVGAFFGRLSQARAEAAASNTVFIVRYCERQYARGNYQTDPEFMTKLDAAIKRPVWTEEGEQATGIHLAVACLGIVPSQLPTEMHRALPVQCYFGPPNTEERERLFRKFFAMISNHTDLVSTLKSWVTWDISDECISYLADHSASRSVGEIREFVTKVYHSILGLFYAQKPVTIDFDFVRSHLAQGEYLNETNPNDREDEFRRYAGVPQSYQTEQDAGDAFGQGVKRARKGD
jgi:hypothetical protein